MSVLEIATRLQESAFTATVQAHAWIVPTLQSIHIVMIGVVFVSMLVVSLRVIGLMRLDETLAEVWTRFAPFFWTGLVVMAVSGVLLTFSEPVRELMTLSFRLKMILLVVAVISAVAFGRSLRATSAPGHLGARASSGLRTTAVLSVCLWLVIIFLGRAIAYDDLIWGSWSPATLQGGVAP